MNNVATQFTPYPHWGVGAPLNAQMRQYAASAAAAATATAAAPAAAPASEAFPLVAREQVDRRPHEGMYISPRR